MTPATALTLTPLARLAGLAYLAALAALAYRRRGTRKNEKGPFRMKPLPNSPAPRQAEQE